MKQRVLVVYFAMPAPVAGINVLLLI